MAKQCWCGSPVFSKGFCQKHWRMAYQKPLKRTELKTRQAPIKRSTKPIAPATKKKQAERKTYSAIRKVWLQDHEVCEARLPGCGYAASQVHHKQGRDTEELLLDTDKWLACCGNCHDWINEHSAEAVELGLSLKRNT